MTTVNPGESAPPGPAFYKDKAGEWRWHIRAANGKITGASTEGFNTLEAAKRNCELNNMTI